MKKYLAEIFGLSVKIEDWNGKSKLPLYLRNKREYFVPSIGDVQSVLMKNNSAIHCTKLADFCTGIRNELKGVLCR